MIEVLLSLWSTLRGHEVEGQTSRKPNHTLHPSVRRDYIECLEEKRREDEYEARNG